MLVEAQVKKIVIPKNWLVAASDKAPIGKVRLIFTLEGTAADDVSVEMDKGVALAVRDEINRVIRRR